MKALWQELGIYFFTVRRDLSFFLAETYGTYHLMGFCTLAPGRTLFQLYRPIIGMVGVDVTPGKASKNP